MSRRLLVRPVVDVDLPGDLRNVLEGVHGPLVGDGDHVGPQVGRVEAQHEEGEHHPDECAKLPGGPLLEPGKRVCRGSK